MCKVQLIGPYSGAVIGVDLVEENSTPLMITHLNFRTESIKEPFGSR